MLTDHGRLRRYIGVGGPLILTELAAEEDGADHDHDEHDAAELLLITEIPLWSSMKPSASNRHPPGDLYIQIYF